MAEYRLGASPLFLRDEELREGLDLLFLATRDLTAEADAILAKQGLGRAHHRALYFIGRRPGLTVSELMAILGITKQSLGRVLKDLAAKGMLQSKVGPTDRRERRLALTEAGLAMEQALSAPQRALMATAYRNAGAEAVNGFRTVLAGLARERDTR
ncbi:MAG: MarR family transcriptional regulator [Rhodospirillaceae bacterium]|nr:MarR family transcriptional regulator [Rhodospirillaceae bacterium]